jgi:hypothetical protein
MPQRSRTIVAWAGGPRAAALDGTPDQERIERARDQFATIFGQRELARREFEGGVTHDWSTDPFACGAYSYVKTGAGSARAALAAPVDDTLFFAGEATATGGQGGTVSGAFESGIRAAREAARALASASSPSETAPSQSGSSQIAATQSASSEIVSPVIAPPPSASHVIAPPLTAPAPIVP